MVATLFKLFKISRDASLVILGGAFIIWAMPKFKEVFDPKAFNQALDMKITDAEKRSKEYADIRYFDMKNSIDRIDRNVESVNRLIIKMYQEKHIGSTLEPRKNVN